MNTKLNLLVITILMSGCATPVQYSDSNMPWSYTGQEGSENWGISSRHSNCSQGVNRSLNSNEFIAADLAPLELAYQSGRHEIVNNGHTIQVKYQIESQLDVNGHY